MKWNKQKIVFTKKYSQNDGNNRNDDNTIVTTGIS